MTRANRRVIGAVLASCGLVIVIAGATLLRSLDDRSSPSEPGPTATGSASVNPTDLEPGPHNGMPVVADAADAAILARSVLNADPSVSTEVSGPVDVPGAGRHWLVTVGVEPAIAVFVGLVTGEAVEASWVNAILTPNPQLARLSVDQAKQLAMDAAGPGGIVGEGSVSSVGFPPHRAWCGKVHPQAGDGSIACVDLNSGEVFTEAEYMLRSSMSEAALAAAVRVRSDLDDAITSQRLVAALEPDESVMVVVTRLPENLGDLDARIVAAGVTRLPQADGWGLVGPWEAVFRIAADLPAQRILVVEDRAALREIPAAPLAALPVAVHPYGFWPRSAISEVAGGAWPPADTEAQALDAIARQLQSLGGEPYDHLSATWLCEFACQVTVIGELLGQGVDRLDYTADADGGVRPWPAGGRFEAVPRAVVREAERIARANAATTLRIGEYETIAGAYWMPDKPQLIVLRYERPARTGFLPIPDSPIAATARSTDWLLVSVDLRLGRVTDITEDLGEDHPI